METTRGVMGATKYHANDFEINKGFFHFSLIKFFGFRFLFQKMFGLFSV